MKYAPTFGRAYDLWMHGACHVQGWSEDAMRDYIFHMGFEKFEVYRSDGYDVTGSFAARAR